jgi:hypothetical protein
LQACGAHAIVRVSAESRCLIHPSAEYRIQLRDSPKMSEKCSLHYVASKNAR